MKKVIITLSIVAMLALVALAVYLIVKKKGTGDSPITGVLGIGGGTNTSDDDPRFPLKHNPHVKIDLVKSLQAKLNGKLEACIEPNFPKDASGKYIKSLDEDGYFGDNTLAVVKFVFNGKEQVTQTMYNSL